MTKGNTSPQHRHIVDFYDRHLRTLKYDLPQAHGRADSFWEQPRHGGFSIVEMDAQDFRSELKVLWSQHVELQQLIEPLYRLSQAIEEPSDLETEISPFIYAMF